MWSGRAYFGPPWNLLWNWFSTWFSITENLTLSGQIRVNFLSPKVRFLATNVLIVEERGNATYIFTAIFLNFFCFIIILTSALPYDIFSVTLSPKIIAVFPENILVKYFFECWRKKWKMYIHVLSFLKRNKFP